ncbi:MAG: hypothetical protein ACTSRC_15210 [Candidatus Helarchaeota archaeon]
MPGITIGDPQITIWNAWLYFFMYTFKVMGHMFTGGLATFPFNWEYFWDNYTISIYYFGFEVCIVVAIISMILFLKKCDPDWSFRAFLFMVGMLILVTLTSYAHYLTDLAHLGIQEVTMILIIVYLLAGILLIKKAFSELAKKKSRTIFYFCFAIFLIVIPYTSQGLFDTIPSFYFDSLSNNVVNIDFVGFVTNPIFLAAFCTFLFLEITYLTAYNYAVGKPALEREQVIDEQLQELARLGEQSTEPLKAKAELHSISIRRFFSSEAFDFMREVIEKGVYDKEVQARMASLRDYQHLQTYLEDLYIKDPGARDSLTARGSLPAASRLVKALIIGTGWRVGMIFALIIICFSPLAFFNILSWIFPSLVASYLEIGTVAAVIVLTVPLVLMFPFIGNIIKLRRLPKIEEEEPEVKTKKIEVKKMGKA